MAELSRTTIREQLGADDPAAGVTGLCIRILDPSVQAYVTRGSDLGANTVEGDDPYRVWLAPDRMLLVSDAPHLLSENGSFVSDVTDGLALFELMGPRAGDVIAAGCTLASTEIVPGRCAQTVFGGVRVLLYARGGGFRIHVERQLAAFLLEWFRRAASALS